MRIVVLDGYTLNPGDLSWSEIADLGDLVVYDRTPEPEIVDRCRGTSAVLTNKTPLSRETLERLPDLRYIGVLATGYNIVDVDAARERGIVVTNVPEYGTHAVAQATFALILELANHVGHYSRRVREGAWSASPDWCFVDPGRVPLELAGLTLGVVGFGRIGSQVGRIGQALGMKVVAHDPSDRDRRFPEVAFVGLDELARVADVVTLHCPLTAENREMVDARFLARMKPTAFLVNTSRGPLVKDADLAAALRVGTIAGAALDVLTVEPPGPDQPLLSAPNCIVTPHISWVARAARRRLMSTVSKNLKGFLDGNLEQVSLV